MSDAAPLTSNHLSLFIELRRRFFRCVLAIFAGAGVGWYFSADLILIMQLPFTKIMGPDRIMIFTAPHEGFVAHLVVGLVAGLILAAPYLFLQVWWFFAPVFYRRQKTLFFFFAMLSAITFVGGALFGYFGILPAAIDFLVQGFEQRAPLTAMLSVQKFLSFSLKLLIVFGLAFELPIVMLILGRLGVVNAGLLWRGFRYAVVLIIVAAGRQVGNGDDHLVGLAGEDAIKHR